METRQRGFGLRRRVVGLLAVMAVGATVAFPAYADDEQTAFDEVRGRRAWTAWADVRPVSPFVGLPFELTFGAPFARAFLDSTPGRSEAFAAPYYGDEVIEETYEASGYKNHTLARSNFPDIGRGTESQWAPAGADGPSAAVKTPSRTEATGDVRNGVAGVTPAGWAHARAVYDRADLITNEASGAASAIKLNEAGSIGSIESMVKVEHRLGQEPVITYRITLAGVQAGGQQLIGYGREGLTLAGTKVAGPDLADQFNAQLAEHGDALAKVAAKLSLRLFEPRVEKHDDGGYLVTGPVAWFRSDNAPRKDQAGDNMGLRLGYVRTYSYLIGVGG